MKLLDYSGQEREFNMKKIRSKKLVSKCPDSKGCAK